jgi:outer membrane protein TolC
VREVRTAAMQLEQNRQRIETTRLGRELSEQRLDAEQKRFEVGMSTNFNVIQAQRDLAVARNAELQAQLDYQLTMIAYQTVQRVGGAVGVTTTTPTGSNVTIPAATSTGTTGTTTPTGPGGSGGD